MRFYQFKGKQDIVISLTLMLLGMKITYFLEMTENIEKKPQQFKLYTE